MFEQERAKIARAKEIASTTHSPYLKRDLQKYIRRAERELKCAERLGKSKNC